MFFSVRTLTPGNFPLLFLSAVEYFREKYLDKESLCSLLLLIGIYFLPYIFLMGRLKVHWTKLISRERHMIEYIDHIWPFILEII